MIIVISSRFGNWYDWLFNITGEFRGRFIIFNYKHQVVRDLAWAIASPPLLELREKTCFWYGYKWYREHYESSKDLLLQIDKEPGELESKLANQKDRRLGKRFETLWAFWLEKSPRFEVVAQNMPLRDGDKTLGELDFLVIDKNTGKYLHWEMAVKFYLGVGDTALHCNWYGPGRGSGQKEFGQQRSGKEDRLDKKVKHLKYKQSVICEQPVVRDLLNMMKIQVDDCGVILKGRLFYPDKATMPTLFPIDASREHLRAFWVSMHAFIRSYSGKGQFCPLIGHGWMAIDKDNVRNGMDKNELVEAITCGELRLPLYVACSIGKSHIERFFIVSDDWSANL